jgi:membrane fusion protein, copper/silver efflux system
MSDQDDAQPEPAEDRGPPRGVRSMALVRWLLVALMALIAVASVAYSLGRGVSQTSSEASTTYYCPMHPQIVQDHPGECPICGMTLVLKEGGGTTKAKSADKGSHEGHRHNPADPYFCPMHPEETGVDEKARCPICGMKMEKRAAPKAAPLPTGAHAGHRHDPNDPYFCPMHPEETGVDEKARCPICEMKMEKRAVTTPPVTQGVPGLVPVELSLDRVQLIGIRTAPATSEKLASELRAVGYVTADEGKLARVHARFSGWIEGLAVPTTGQKVRRGQVLASVYNRELFPAQQEFLAARRWSSAPATPGEHGLAAPMEQDARTRLEILGMSRGEIDAIAKSGKPSRTVAVTAPIGGYVVAKQAVQGGFVQPGMPLFDIADLSKVWVLADVYEYESGRVAVGQKARIELAGQRGQRVEGKLGFVYPALEPTTRTLRVRVELDNPELKLRPGMYADVFIDIGEAKGVVVPREAVVDTGDHQYVFVAKDAGRFEPRLVQVGARSEDKVQIVWGVADGETVVTTANFLVDSESRLKAAIEGK